MCIYGRNPIICPLGGTIDRPDNTGIGRELVHYLPKYCLFIVVIKYSPSDFISTIKTSIAMSLPFCVEFNASKFELKHLKNTLPVIYATDLMAM